jgi:Protein of unknown function (DUF1353)
MEDDIVGIRDKPEGIWRDDGLFELGKTMLYYIGRKHSGLQVHVPKTYACDMASVPVFIRWLIPRFGAHDAPAILHDWLYNTHLTSKPTADAVFYEALLVCQVRTVPASLMYMAVSAFGHGSYKSGPATLRRRAPHLAAMIFDSPALPGREKERPQQ